MSEETKVKTPKSVGKDNMASRKPKKDAINLLSISFGAGGGNLGVKLQEVTGKKNGIFINTSAHDLRVLTDVDESMKFKIGNVDGTGADRDLSKGYIKNPSTMESFFNKYKSFLYGDNLVIVVFFTLAGGTGSGAAPSAILHLTKLINEFEGSIKKNIDGKMCEIPVDNTIKPTIMCVGVLPSLKNELEGQRALQNTADCLNELNKLVENKLISLMLVSNDNTTHESMDIAKVYDEINTSVAKYFFRLTKLFGTSTLKTLDVADRLRAMTIPGLATMKMLDGSTSPFVFPTGCSYIRCIGEVPENTHEHDLRDINDMLNENSINVSDTRMGYMNAVSIQTDTNTLSTSETTSPYVYLSGYMTLRKLLSPYIVKLNLILKQQQDTEDVSKIKNDFSRISESKNKILSTESKSTNIDLDIL